MDGAKRAPANFSLAIALAAVLFLPSFAHAQDAVAKWINRLDDAYYYPQRQGLEQLSVRIEWNRGDPASDRGAVLRFPEVDFNWEKGSAGRFSLSPETSPMAREAEREVLSAIENYREVIVPLPLKDKFSSYRGKRLPSSRDRLHLEFESGDSGEMIRKYQLIVDRVKFQIRKFRMLRNQAPEAIASQLAYTEREGKWLVAESRSRFQWDGKDHEDISEFSYQSVQGIWLPRKLTHTIRQGGNDVQTTVLSFKDYRLTVGDCRGSCR